LRVSPDHTPSGSHALNEPRAVDVRVGSSTDALTPVSVAERSLAAGPQQWLALGAVAVLGAGAYGFVMASNYNTRPRPVEVLVDGDRYTIVRRRETFEDLVAGETAV